MISKPKRIKLIILLNLIVHLMIIQSFTLENPKQTFEIEQYENLIRKCKEYSNGLVEVYQEKIGQKRFRFDYIIRYGSKRHRKIESGTYQRSEADRGNYNNSGQLVGTNRSIAAKTYENFTGKRATISRMKNISKGLAKKIYKEKYWKEVMKGHLMKVHNPLLLDMIFNAICSSWGSVHFKEVLSKISGIECNGFYITKEEIEIFNRICKNPLKEAIFYREYWNIRNQYYLKKSKKKDHEGLSKWIKDYDKNAYESILSKVQLNTKTKN